jgi:hypothetical protein
VAATATNDLIAVTAASTAASGRPPPTAILVGILGWFAWLAVTRWADVGMIRPRARLAGPEL